MKKIGKPLDSVGCSFLLSEKTWKTIGICMVFVFGVMRKLGTPMDSVILFSLRWVPRVLVCKIDSYGLCCSDMTGSMFV